MKKIKKSEAILILLDIRSAYNVGAIFRTADGAGVDRIYLIGTTPTPLDRFGGSRKDIAKVALGAEKTVSWEYVKTIFPLLAKLKKEKFQIIAIEQDEGSIDYKKIKIRKKAALILGSETEGIPEKILKRCDSIAEIPMRGKKESLNVSVAAGIALYQMI